MLFYGNLRKINWVDTLNLEKNVRKLLVGIHATT